MIIYKDRLYLSLETWKRGSRKKINKHLSLLINLRIANNLQLVMESIDHTFFLSLTLDINKFKVDLTFESGNRQILIKIVYLMKPYRIPNLVAFCCFVWLNFSQKIRFFMTRVVSEWQNVTARKMTYNLQSWKINHILFLDQQHINEKED